MDGMVKHPQVVYTDLDDGAVLLHLDTRFYYSINEVGVAIWRLLDVGRADDIVRRLMADYDVDERSAEAALAGFVQTLQGENLVLPGSDGDGQTSAGLQGPAVALTPGTGKKPFSMPELLKHAEPLHELVMNPFDPQLPLAE